MIKKTLMAVWCGGLITVLLSGCARQYPGGYAQVATDKPSHSLQFRYTPGAVDLPALNTTVRDYCHQHGFDKVEPLPEQDSGWPGEKTRWFQCNYGIKN
ncbi:hypothetical protein [Tatumella punctata]|uniref:Lipoprotein n=1 Tax=Tatumella punctata TaxID=399969 RepID=A0ABW1VR35_9GAMM